MRLSRAFAVLGVLLVVSVVTISLARRSATREASPLPAEVGRPAVAPPFDLALLTGDAAMERVRRFVAVGPRVSGTEGAEAAAHHLMEELEAMGHDPLLDMFSEETSTGPMTFRNVYAFVSGRGTDQVIIASHYDTKGGISDTFAGANDSGSSTGLLLELARVIKDAPERDYAVTLAFFDGEECQRRYGPNDGLHGSRHLVKTLITNQRVASVRGAIVIDMIGDADLSLTVPRNSSPELTALLFEAAREQGVRSMLSLPRTQIVDDHVPFLAAGIPAIDLIDFHYGSRPHGNDYWHTDADTLDKVSPQSLETVGHLVLRMLNKM